MHDFQSMRQCAIEYHLGWKVECVMENLIHMAHRATRQAGPFSEMKKV